MKLTALLPLAFALTACDSGPSKEESLQIFAAANTAMTSAQSRAVTEAQGQSPVAPADLVLDFSGPCTLGGTVALTGSYSGDGTGTQATFDLATTFVACQEATGTIDGDVHWTSSANPAGFAASMTGDLAWTGSNGSGSCSLDLQMSVSAVAISYSGSLCGYDVTTDLTLMP
jgi:hypothetical protein